MSYTKMYKLASIATIVVAILLLLSTGHELAIGPERVLGPMVVSAYGGPHAIALFDISRTIIAWLAFALFQARRPVIASFLALICAVAMVFHVTYISLIVTGMPLALVIKVPEAWVIPPLSIGLALLLIIPSSYIVVTTFARRGE